jgi:hypothetical protein
VQTRLRYQGTGEQYVREEGWQEARLDRCPLHPALRPIRHGTYERKSPAGTKVARFLCPTGHTISLLPDFLCSRLSGTLDEVEAAAVADGGSRETAAAELRPEIGTAGGLRWLDRRRRYVRETIDVVRAHAPALIGEVVTLKEWRRVQGGAGVLAGLRAHEGLLSLLGLPVGLRPAPESSQNTEKAGAPVIPHETGADPPS